MGSEPSKPATSAPVERAMESNFQCTCRCGSGLYCRMPTPKGEHHEVDGEAKIAQVDAEPGVLEACKRNDSLRNFDELPKPDAPGAGVFSDDDDESSLAGVNSPDYCPTSATPMSATPMSSQASSIAEDQANVEKIENSLDEECKTGPLAAKFAEKKSGSRFMINSILDSMPSQALQIMIDNPDNIYGAYTIKEPPLGKGKFGTVSKAMLKATGAIRAIKSISKHAMKMHVEALKAEIDILKMINHPNLIILYEIFENEDNLYLVMDLCSGGCLSERVHRDGYLNEVQAAVTMQHILRGVYYLHSNNIVHRDMKSDNCLLATKGPLEKNRTKIADMGLSCIFQKGKPLTKTAGTLTHMAPEVLAHKYTNACDVWSCGVVIYQLLCGMLPFSGDVAKEVTRGIPSYEPEDRWADISSEAYKFVNRLLTKNPKNRCTAGEALKHSWIENTLPKAKEVSIPASVIGNLRRYRRLSRFKRAALSVIASMLGEAYISKPRAIFIAMDTNGDGLLSIEELKARLLQMRREGKTVEDIDSYVETFFEEKNRMSMVSSGTFSLNKVSKMPSAEKQFRWRQSSFMSDQGLQQFTYMEFLAATFDRAKCLHKEMCWAAFRAFDKNGDGVISMVELLDGRMLGMMSADEAREALIELDTDENGYIDFSEFVEMLCKE